MHDDRFTGREDTLLVTVGLALPEVLDHRQAHRLGCAVTEQARVADVQGDDFVTLPLEFHRPVRQFAADLIADALKNVVGLDAVLVHGYASRKPQERITPLSHAVSSDAGNFRQP